MYETGGRASEMPSLSAVAAVFSPCSAFASLSLMTRCRDHGGVLGDGALRALRASASLAAMAATAAMAFAAFHSCAPQVKNFVTADKHDALDEMLKRYTSKQLGKQQAREPIEGGSL